MKKPVILIRGKQSPGLKEILKLLSQSGESYKVLGEAGGSRALEKVLKSSPEVIIVESKKAGTDLYRRKKEKAREEAELKSKELLLVTVKLKHLIELYNKFMMKIRSTECKECTLCTFAESHIKEMMDYTNQQIWSELEQHFEQTNDQFFTKLNKLCPTLTPNERKLCAYLRINLSSKDIWSITGQSLRSIEIARTRLREKLGLKGKDDDLNGYLMSI